VSLDAILRANRLVSRRDFVKAFVAEHRTDADVEGAADDSPHICDLDIRHVCQRLTVALSARQRPEFDSGQVVALGRLARVLSAAPRITLKLRPLRSTIAFHAGPKVCFARFDSLFAFATSVALSENRLLLAVDFVFGLTRVYRIVYANFAPVGLEQLSDISWFERPVSVVSGFHLIVATALRDAVAIWDAVGGGLHRRVECGANVRVLAMDDEFGVWVALDHELLLLTVNGERVAAVRVPARVTALAAVPQKEETVCRAAVCGADDGSIWAVQCDMREIDWRQLPSEHVAAVVEIVVHPSLKAFLSVDDERGVWLWTAIEGRWMERFKPEAMDGCATCGANAKAACAACGRAVCPRCRCVTGQRTLCGVCHHHLCC
jgi:hypothetical protein